MANFITIEPLRKYSYEEDLLIFSAMVEKGGHTQNNKGGGSDDGGESAGDGGPKLKEKGEDLKEDMDNLLDEIDSVLEENAEEFVKNYVQRGGE